MGSDDVLCGAPRRYHGAVAACAARSDAFRLWPADTASATAPRLCFALPAGSLAARGESAHTSICSRDGGAERGAYTARQSVLPASYHFLLLHWYHLFSFHLYHYVPDGSISFLSFPMSKKIRSIASLHCISHCTSFQFISLHSVFLSHFLCTTHDR